MSYTYFKVNKTIVICHPISYCVQPDHPHYDHIVDVLENERDEDLTAYLQPIEFIAKQIAGYPDLQIKAEKLYYKDKPVPTYVADKILDLHKHGKPVDRLHCFLSRLDQNPSNRAREELYRFLEGGQLPLTQRGTFLAYKKITSDYTDCHTRTIKQTFHVPVTMDRNMVDDDPNISCSHGLHVCSFEYLRTFDGDRLIVVEVDPGDVVCVPHDHTYTKMRVCKYIPRFEIPMDIAEDVWKQTPFLDITEGEDK